MSPSDANTLSHEEKNPAASLYSLDLEPLRADGPDALIPDPAERILDVKVHRIDILWENALHELNTTIAVDVFHSVVSVENDAAPIPPGAKLIHATLHFLFPDSPQPHAADISPPNTLRLQFPDDAPRILAFLAKHHFTTPKKLAQLLAILLPITAALATDAIADDTEGDDQHRRERIIRFPI